MKSTLELLGLLLILQILGYLFFGLNHIHRKICTEAPMLVDTSTIKHLGIHTKSWLSPKDKIIMKGLLEPKFGIIDFVENESLYQNNYRINPDRYALSYEINYSIPFIVITKEENGTLYYGEEWEMWYAWVFFKWVEIKKIPRGQS